MVQLWDVVISVLLITGGFFTLVGALGLARLPDFYTRLHAPTKATTLGVGCVVVASIAYFFDEMDLFGVAELLIVVFLFMTAPVSANMLAKAAMHLNVRKTDRTRGGPWEQ